MPAPSPSLAGGCLCGTVRFQLAAGAVADAAFCHCATCRRASGSAFGVWASVAAAALTVVSGSPARFERRAFCAACGTPLWHDGPDGTLRVGLGTLDDPAAVPPRAHAAAAEQLPWLRLADLLDWTEAPEPKPPAERQLWVSPDPDPSVTRASPISLREITDETLRPVLLMDVTGHQRRFVGSNAVSLAQAARKPTAIARAIHAGEVPVGFVLLDAMDADYQTLGLPVGQPYVWRFLIDALYQRLGFGLKALELTADLAKRRHPDAGNLWLSYVPSPVGPHEFYRRCGFLDTPHVDPDGEVFMRRPYPPPAY